MAKLSEQLQRKLTATHKRLEKDQDNDSIKAEIAELESNIASALALESANATAMGVPLNSALDPMYQQPRQSFSTTEPVSPVVGLSRQVRLDANGQEYARRELADTIEMPIAFIDVTPRDVRRADGTYTHRVGQIVLMRPIPNSGGLRVLTLTQALADKIIGTLPTTGVTNLHQLKSLIKPKKATVVIDVLKDDAGNQSFLPMMIILDDVTVNNTIEENRKLYTSDRMLEQPTLD